MTVGKSDTSKISDAWKTLIKIFDDITLEIKDLSITEKRFYDGADHCQFKNNLGRYENSRL
jgi:hypothetical protein